MKKVLIIKADCNDADYVTSELEMNFDEAPEFEAMVRRVLKVINLVTAEEKEKQEKAGRTYFQFHNWPNSEYADGEPKELYGEFLSEDDIEWFDEQVPRGENGIGVHTLKEVRIVQIAEDEELLEVG